MIRREKECLDRPPGDNNQTTGQYLVPLFASLEDLPADRRARCTREDKQHNSFYSNSELLCRSFYSLSLPYSCNFKNTYRLIPTANV